MEAIEKTKSKKDQFHYKKLCNAFITHSYEKKNEWFRYWRGRTLQYDGTKYFVQDEIGHKVRRFLTEAEIPYNNTTIANILPDLQMAVECDTQKYKDMPFWAKEEVIPTKNVMAFHNGLLDVEKAIQGKNDLIKHTPNWVSQVCLPHDYIPDAECPNWLRFLGETLDDDPDRIALLQEFFGYALTADNSYQKMLVLLGVSRGGKGTVVKVLEAMLGEENITGYNLQALADKFGLGGLVGKLVATIGEVNLAGNRDRSSIFQTLNNITGDDPVEIEWKHNPTKVSTRLIVRFVVSCNQLPHFADDSGALAERLLIVNFDRAVPPDKRDPELGNKLIQEISGITNWALEGLARLRNNKRFSQSPRTEETVNSLRRKNSNALAFTQDRLSVHSSIDTGNLPGVDVTDAPIEDTWMTTEDANMAFRVWCDENQIQTNPSYLFSNLQTLLPKLKRKQRKIAGVKMWVLDGVTRKRYKAE